MKRLYSEQKPDLLSHCYTTASPWWEERRIVFFAAEKDDNKADIDSSTQAEQNERAEQQKEKEKNDASTAEENEIDRITVRTAEKAHTVLDTWEYEFPADIDPEKLQKAREVVNDYYPVLEELEEKVNDSIDDLIGKMGKIDNQSKEELWQTVYRTVPEFGKNQLRNNDEFNSSMMPSDTESAIRQSIINIWKRKSDKAPDIHKIKECAHNLAEHAHQIAINEFAMLKVIDGVREVMWDMHKTFQRKAIQERMIRSAGRRAGIPLREGQELKGLGLRMKKGFEEDSPFIEEYPRRWIIKEVFVDQKRNPDPENKKDEEKILMSGVWVALEEKGTGRVHRMSTNRLRDFVNLHDIKPVVKKQKELSNNISHLNEMNITVKAGDTLEYDVMTIDPKTNKPYADVQKVKVVSIDDYGVKLDKKVLYRSFYDSPDLSDHEYKDDFTLGEFAKWMNRFRPVPKMRFSTLLDRLHEHYEYMNKNYKRQKDCHMPIKMEPGEILHADAPGNPLFEVEYVDELKGEIQLKNKRKFTFPQFLRWVYENDIEPFDPDLEAKKMELYFNAGKKSRERAKEDAQKTIEYFQETGTWRDTLQKLREKGIKGIFEPEVKFREDKSVGVEKQSYSKIAQWLRDTQWLRLDDVFKMFQSGWEYYTRNWQRRQKSRYSEVGKHIPWFGTEFDRINQQAETEEVSQFKEAMDQWGVPQIEETLYSTDNQDQAKACLNVLAEKGMIRWDSKELYHTLNKFADINHKLPIPAGDPYKKFEKGSGMFNGEPLEGKNVMDFLQDSMDSIWGEGSYVGWKRQSDGAIESAIQESYNKGEELENDPKNVGGISKELSNMLTRHMHGEWIDPTEYEGMLRFIIEAGKASGKDKIYYLLMGVNAKNPDGKTILGWERVGRFVSKYSNQFPALDFFSASNSDPKRDFFTGDFLVNADNEPRPFVRSDFDRLVSEWVGDGHAKGFFAPEDDVEAFLTNTILTTDAVQNRLEKGIRNAQNMDHDDSPYIIPNLKESEIESICASTGGDTKKFTIQGYKNGYVGFGMRMQALVDQHDKEKYYEQSGEVGFSSAYLQKLITAFKSYIHFDGILDNRYRKKRGAALQRLSSSDYQTGCVWDANRPLRRYQEEMKGLIQEIANAYGHGKDPEITESPFKKGAPESAIEFFGARFEKMIHEDQVPDNKKDRFTGEKMIDIIKNHKFLIETSIGATKEDLFRNKARMYEYDPEAVSSSLPDEDKGKRAA